MTTSTRIEVVQLVWENWAARFEGAKLASPLPPKDPLVLAPSKTEDDEPALACGAWTCADECR